MGRGLRRRGARLVRWARERPASGRAVFAATCGLSLAFQLLFFLVEFRGHVPFPRDAALYSDLARALADGEGFALHGEPTAVVPPLYPLLLAPFFAAGADGELSFALLGTVVGAVAAGLIALVARRAFGPVEGCVAGVLAAGLPTIAYWAPFVLTDTLAVALLAGAVLIAVAPAGLTPRAAAAAGALLGAGLLTRPAMAFPALALIAWLAVRREQRRRIVTAAAACVGVALVLLPWALRNEAEVGRPYALSSFGGANLWVAVHWLPDGRGTPGDDVPPFPSFPGASEPELDDLQRDRAREVLRDDPGRWLRGLYEKPRLVWTLSPEGATGLRQRLVTPDGAKGLGEVWLTLLGLLALAGFAARPELRRGGTWWLWIAGALTLSAALLYIDPGLRYRLPLAVAVVPPAAAALVAFARRPPRLARRTGIAPRG